MDRGAWGCRESDMIDQLSTAHGLGFQRMNRNPRLYCLHLVALDKLLSLSGPVHFICETGDKKQSVVKLCQAEFPQDLFLNVTVFIKFYHL